MGESVEEPAGKRLELRITALVLVADEAIVDHALDRSCPRGMPRIAGEKSVTHCGRDGQAHDCERYGGGAIAPRPIRGVGDARSSELRLVIARTPGLNLHHWVDCRHPQGDVGHIRRAALHGRQTGEGPSDCLCVMAVDLAHLQVWRELRV